MPEGYRHLTHEERCQIGALKESGLSDGAIAARLPAIPSARATPPLREWPVLHFGMEVGLQNLDEDLRSFPPERGGTALLGRRCSGTVRQGVRIMSGGCPEDLRNGGRTSARFDDRALIWTVRHASSMA